MSRRSTTRQTSRYQTSRRRLLVIDESEAIHADFRKILGKPRNDRASFNALEAQLFGEAVFEPADPFEIESAFQGEEGLAMAADARAAGHPFSVAFVDVRMPPGIDGVETAARLLESEPEINVVICSAYSDYSWEEVTQRIGETDRVLILKKPFDAIEVRQLAHTLHRRWELARFAAMQVADLTRMVDARTRELQASNEMLVKEARAREEALERLAKSNEQIRALAYQDGLTNLPNRRLLNEYLENILNRARRKKTAFAVLFVDLDNFKLINDTVGHQAADNVLREFASALGDLIRSEDVLAVYASNEPVSDDTITVDPITDSVLSRLGGDEFVILLPEISDRLAPGHVASRILERLTHPFLVEGSEVFVNSSIGIATFPEDAQSAEDLLRNADTAMYYAKQLGKAGYQYFSAEMNAASVERLMLETGMRKALDDDIFQLHYQPVVDMTTGRVVGAEALLRWNDATRGFISPATFVPIAEDTGLILAISERMMLRACQDAVGWQNRGLPAVPLSINVSGVQFRRQNLVELVRSALKQSGLEPRHLCLEITETSLVSASDDVADCLSELHAMGVSVALDDFGTGYSSLSYLKSFALDILKLDRSFIAELLTDDKTASITEAIVSMARIIGIEVIAEGVETKAQLDFLRGRGCRLAQGFYFSPAVDAARFAGFLNSPFDLRELSARSMSA